MAKGKRFALGVNLDEKGGCATSMTLCQLAVLQRLLQEVRLRCLRKTQHWVELSLETIFFVSLPANRRKKVPDVQVLLCSYHSI